MANVQISHGSKRLVTRETRRERERDAYFWNDLFVKFDVEFVFLFLQTILGAVAIRLRLSCGFSDQLSDDLGSLSSLGLE